MCASSSLISISITKSWTSHSSFCSSKSLHFLTPFSINPIPKTHKLSFTFKPKLNFSPILVHSSIQAPSCSQSHDSSQVDETPKSEPLTIEDELVDTQEEDDDDFDDDEEAAQTESPEAGRLYIGNLPYAITASELSQVFGEAGIVNSVEIVYDRVTDRSRGFAFITMASVQEAKEAIRMFNGSQIGGRTVKVNFPEVPRGGEREVMGPKIRSSNREFIESPYKIYAGNLSWIITSERLKDAFADQPGLLSAKVIYEKHSGRSRGFGFVTFNSSEAAESALDAMNEVEVEGRPLRLNLAAGKTDTSRPPRSGRSSEVNVDESEILSSISS
uniref:33 kDa ribonucleoprotein, chloroplastic n=1 Tax=Erigeron canadensis TaxID=72917 RepID=UPI001CB8B8C3|nr:33 kDa ribonucleoprotein, chloroplastic [Erigeron canadensis]